ncbi:hypothetical protein WDW89_13630 [Deltaproteobacteria bacterium TL4]
MNETNHTTAVIQMLVIILVLSFFFNASCAVVQPPKPADPALYTTPVFTLQDRTPVYAFAEGQKIVKYLSFMETVWTCKKCISESHPGRLQTFWYDGDEVDSSQQFKLMGYLEKKDLLRTRTVLKDEDKHDIKVILSNDPVQHKKGDKLDKIPVRFNAYGKSKVEKELDVFDFYMVYARTGDFLLIGKDGGINNPLYPKETVIGWIPNFRATLWTTREALQFNEDNRKDRQKVSIYVSLRGLEESDPWEIIAEEDIRHNITPESFRFPVIHKNEDENYYEIYYYTGNTVSLTPLFGEGLRKEIEYDFTQQGIPPDRLNAMVDEQMKLISENKTSLFRRGFVSINQNDRPQMDEMELVERKHIVMLLSNFQEILSAYDSGSKKRVEQCMQASIAILKNRFPEKSKEELKTMISEEQLVLEAINQKVIGLNFQGSNALLLLPCEQWGLMDPVELESDANRLRLSQDRLIKILNNQQSLNSGQEIPHAEYPHLNVFQIVKNYTEIQDPVSGQLVEVDYRPRKYWFKRGESFFAWIPLSVFP